MNARHSSASNEHYTPPEIVERARAVLDGFDLDPASCVKANKLVRARRIYTAKTNGFNKRWTGRVFLNPPGGFCDAAGRTVPDRSANAQSSQRAWWFKLAREWACGNVEAAIFVCFSVELLQTAQAGNTCAPTPLDFPICFPRTRVDYLRDHRGRLERGGGPPHASCIVLLPPRERGEDDEATTVFDRFEKEFGQLGRVTLP